MKKLIFAAAILCAAMMTSCGNKQTSEAAEVVDTTEVAADTIAVDTIIVEGEATEVVEETTVVEETVTEDVTGAARK